MYHSKLIVKIFEKQVVIVAVGSFGIGKAAAKAFTKRGAKVAIADWKEDYSTLKSIQAEDGYPFLFPTFRSIF